MPDLQRVVPREGEMVTGVGCQAELNDRRVELAIATGKPVSLKNEFQVDGGFISGLEHR